MNTMKLNTKIPSILFTNKKTFENEDRIDFLESFLESNLPHGSGIGHKWEYVFHKNGNITCRNSYHAMNENGYYDGIMSFKFTIWYNPVDNKLSFNHIVCNENRKNSFYGLKEYLTDNIHWTLSEMELTNENTY